MHNRPLKFFACLLALWIVTLAVFATAIDHKFIAWDDQAELYANPDFNPVTWQHVCDNIWHTHNGLTVWMPLTYFVWGGIAAVAHQPADRNGISLDPIMFHAACVVFHLIAVGFCFSILRRLLGRDLPAMFGAAIFALHPLQVEPVAWASGMYTVLSGALSLAAIDGYLRAIDAKLAGRRWMWFAISSLLFVMAMLTKPSAIVLPVIVVAIQLIRCIAPSPLEGEGRGEGEDAHLKVTQLAGEDSRLKRSSESQATSRCALAPHPNPLPQGEREPKRGATILFVLMMFVWMPLAIADFCIAKHFHPATNVPASPISSRAMVASDAISFYLAKLFVPIHLVPDYGRWPARVIAMPKTQRMLIAPIALLALAIAIWRRAPRVALAIAIFLLGIAPFLGLVRFDYQFFSTVADRYAYLAMLGPALLVGAILSRWPNLPAYCIAGAIGIALAILSFFQVQHWQDTQTVFNYTLSVRPDSLVAHRVLAMEEFQTDPASAEEHFKRVIDLRPDDAVTHYNYGLLLGRRRDLPGAIEQFKATITLNPDHAKALDSLGIAMWRQGKLDDAEDYFQRAVDAAEKANNDFPEARQHLATLHERIGHQ